MMFDVEAYRLAVLKARGSSGDIAFTDSNGNITSDNVADALEEVGALLPLNPNLTAAEVPNTEAELYEGLMFYNETTNSPQWCVIPGEQEVDTLEIESQPVLDGAPVVTLNGTDVSINVRADSFASYEITFTGPATATGDITVTLNSVDYDFAVAAEDPGPIIAQKISDSLVGDTDWIGIPAFGKITITALAAGTKTGTFAFDAGTTGVEATDGIVMVNAGNLADTIEEIAEKFRSETYSGWQTGGTGAFVTFTKDIVGVCSAPVFDTGGSGVAATFTRTNEGAATVWAMLPNAGVIKTDTVTPTDLYVITGAEKTIVLDSSVYDDIIINPSNLRGGVTAPAFAEFIAPIYQLLFLNSQTDTVYGSFELPHSYKEGTPLEIHIHWSPSNDNTGDCVWLFKYSIAGMGTEVFSAPSTLTATDAGDGIPLKHQYATMDALIPGAGRKIGDIVVFELSRPNNDGFTGDAFLHSVGAHYEIDTLGSRQRGIK